MNVRDLMTANPRTVSPDTPLKDVAAVLAEHGISGLPVCDAEGNVLGVVSEGDILFKERGHVERRGGFVARIAGRRLTPEEAKRTARTAGEAMTAPAITITPERPAAAAARMMIDRGVNRLPVVRDGALVGIVTRADLVRAFTRSDEEVAEEIEEHVLRRSLWAEPDAVTVTVTDGAVELYGELEARSDVEVLTKLVQRVPGVVSVESRVGYRSDDVSRVPA